MKQNSGITSVILISMTVTILLFQACKKRSSDKLVIDNVSYVSASMVYADTTIPFNYISTRITVGPGVGFYEGRTTKRIIISFSDTIMVPAYFFGYPTTVPQTNYEIDLYGQKTDTSGNYGIYKLGYSLDAVGNVVNPDYFYDSVAIGNGGYIYFGNLVYADSSSTISVSKSGSFTLNYYLNGVKKQANGSFR